MSARIAAILVLLIGASVSSCADLKKAGREVGHGTRDAAKAIGHGARDVAKDVGKAVNKAAKN